MGNLILDDMKVIVRCEKTIIRSMRLVGGHVELSGVRGFKQVLGVVGTMDFLFGLSVLFAMGAAFCAGWRVLHARSKDESSEHFELTENGDA